MLEIGSTDVSQDLRLNFLIEQTSSLIEEFLDRPKLTRQSRTEYLDGSGTQKLLLTHRPVYVTPTIEVYVDESGHFGAPDDAFAAASALTWGDDFFLALDREDNTKSRSGILVRMNAVWPKPPKRQRGWLSPFSGQGHGTIKVVYDGGLTVDDLPAMIRMAANIIIARLNHMFPIGMFTTSESYEERSISFQVLDKDKLLGDPVRGMLMAHRNWSFGGR